MNRILPVVVVSSLVSSLALAAGVPVKDKEAITFNEIERGPFFGVSGGWNFLLNAPSLAGNRPFSPGQMAEVEVGFELGDRLALAGFVAVAQNKAGADYIGQSDGTYSGDFASLTPGATLRLNAVGFDDAQGVKRTWLYVRGGAGFTLFAPRTLLPNADVTAFGGPGIEYFTRMRHFSIGLEADVSFMVTSATLGFQLTPNLRYSF